MGTARCVPNHTRLIFQRHSAAQRAFIQLNAARLRDVEITACGIQVHNQGSLRKCQIATSLELEPLDATKDLKDR